MSTSHERHGIQSLEIGVTLFKVLHDLGRPVALHELATAACMHRAKLHRYLVSLIRTGLVAQDPDRRYRPGPYALRLMGNELTVLRLRERAHSAMPALAREVGETVFLCGWRGVRPYIAHVEEPPRSIFLRPAVGAEVPLLRSSPGRAFGAYLAPEHLESLLEAELQATVPPAQRIAQRSAYLRELAQVRKRGLSRSLGERYPGINSLSAPILSEERTAIMIIAACGLRETFDAAWTGQVARTLRRWADTVGTPFAEANALRRGSPTRR